MSNHTSIKKQGAQERYCSRTPPTFVPRFTSTVRLDAARSHAEYSERGKANRAVYGKETWGAYPGHPIYDIQSGNGVVHNSLMFAQPQKSVLRSSFRSTPTPTWFASEYSKARKVFPKLVKFEASPSLLKVPGIMWAALKG